MARLNYQNEDDELPFELELDDGTTWTLWDEDENPGSEEMTEHVVDDGEGSLYIVACEGSSLLPELEPLTVYSVMKLETTESVVEEDEEPEPEAAAE